MHMDEGEIIRSYQAAKNHKEQVQVLADLNNVSRTEMAKWLIDHGQAVDKRLLPKGEAAAESGEAPQKAVKARQSDSEPLDDKIIDKTTETAGNAIQEAKNGIEHCDVVVHPTVRKEPARETKTKVYIAGAITNNPDYEMPFAMVEEWLAGLGFEPVNPAKNREESYKAYIDTGLRQLAECNLICMIPGWVGSAGASFEHQYAELVGIPEILIPEKVWAKIEVSV